MIYVQASIAKMIADKISTTTTISHVLVKVPTGWRVMPAAMAPAGLAVKAAYEPPKPKHKGKGKPTTIGLDMGGQDDGVDIPYVPPKGWPVDVGFNFKDFKKNPHPAFDKHNTSHMMLATFKSLQKMGYVKFLEKFPEYKAGASGMKTIDKHLTLSKEELKELKEGQVFNVEGVSIKWADRKFWIATGLPTTLWKQLDTDYDIAEQKVHVIVPSPAESNLVYEEGSLLKLSYKGPNIQTIPKEKGKFTAGQYMAGDGHPEHSQHFVPKKVQKKTFAAYEAEALLKKALAQAKGGIHGVGSPQMKAHNYLIQAAQAEVAQEKAAKEGLAKAVQAAQAKVATQKLMHEKWLKEHPGAATPTEAHSKYVEHLKQKAITDEPLITKWDPLASEFVSAEDIKWTIVILILLAAIYVWCTYTVMLH